MFSVKFRTALVISRDRLGFVLWSELFLLV